MTRNEVLSYEQRLTGHVDQCVSAVMDNPEVRRAEFATLHALANLTSPVRILEFSAEGAYA